MEKRKLKVIKITFTKKHLIFGIICLIAFITIISYNPDMFGFYEKDYIHCTDGTSEVLTINKSRYCGVNISDEGYYILNDRWTK